ncbi:MAG: DUF1731 domain-containing protein [Chloroflexi bacterium]|nr:DUF1731 domain-containing protein [Chloroflexota bacterium]
MAHRLRRPTRLRLPASLVHLALGEQQTLVQGSRRVWPGVALDHGFRFRHPILEAALAATIDPGSA